MKDLIPWSLGGEAVTNLAWFDLAATFWQCALAAGGAALLILSVRSKWLEIKQRKRDLTGT